jgi:hypothetical protein
MMKGDCSQFHAASRADWSASRKVDAGNPERRFLGHAQRLPVGDVAQDLSTAPGSLLPGYLLTPRQFVGGLTVIWRYSTTSASAAQFLGLLDQQSTRQEHRI